MLGKLVQFVPFFCQIIFIFGKPEKTNCQFQKFQWKQMSANKLYSFLSDHFFPHFFLSEISVEKKCGKFLQKDPGKFDLKLPDLCGPFNSGYNHLYTLGCPPSQ